MTDDAQRALADFRRFLRDIPRRNALAQRQHSTDRWGERCGGFAELAWPTDRGGESWLCLQCRPVRKGRP